jgi:peptidoglycan/LPS O-acetylase OafA/YrhL
VRGAAAVIVVLFHAGATFPAMLASGYLAVDLFFVLSGFVICSAYGARLTSGAACAAFIVRRFGRLWPVYAVAMALWCVAYVLGSGSVPSPRQALALATFTQGLSLFDHPVGLVTAWSVADEFYVYVAFALVCLATRRYGRIGAFTALAAVGYAVAVWASVAHDDCLRVGWCLGSTFSYGWSQCLSGFFLGVLVDKYKDAPLLQVVTRRVPQLLCAAAVVLLLTLADMVRALALAAPLVFAVFVASLARDCGAVARFFQDRPFQYLGKVSYSLYLGHLLVGPFMNAAFAALPQGVRLVLYLAVSIAFAHLLTRYVETPWRRRFNAWADTVSRPRANAVGSARAT